MENKKSNKKHQACVNRYIAKAYDRINLTVLKGKKEEIKAHANQFDGGSVNGFIQRAIEETMDRDKLNAEGKE